MSEQMISIGPSRPNSIGAAARACRILRLIAMLLLAGSALPVAAAAKEPALAPRSYTYSVEPNVSPDPEHKALLDGKPDRVAWYRQGVVEISFDLGSTSRIGRVEFDAYRGAPTPSRVRDAELFLDDGTGYRLIDKKTNLAGADYSLKPREKPALGVPPLALIDDKPVTIGFADVNQNAYRLRLRLTDGYQPGPSFGITEVRIFGRPITEQATTKPATPAEQAAALQPYTVPDTGNELVLQEGSFDRDPARELLLANKFVKLVIEPELGGVISSFSYRGVELTQPKSLQSPGGGGGLLSDHVTSQPLEGDWFNAPYQYQIVEKSPERISVKLSATGSRGSLAYLTFNKTITLWKGRPDVEVQYEMALDKKATAPLPFQFWFHSFVGTRDAGRKSSAATFYFPEENGIQALKWGGEKDYDRWFSNPSRGWAGMVDSQRRIGLAFGVDYASLRNFYSWGSKGNNGLPTLEWRFNPVSIPDGGSFKTTITLMPLNGLEHLAGMNAGLAGDLIYEPKGGQGGTVQARLAGASGQTLHLVFRDRVLPNGAWQVFYEKDLAMAADQTAEVSAGFDPAGAGTHVLSMLAMREGREVLNLETPLVVGTPSSAYVMQPPPDVRRPGSADSKVRTRYVSTEYETPHVKWARPYHGGKTKALVLVDGRYQREVVELAQRIDLDFDSTYLFPTDVSEALSDFYGQTTLADLRLGLERLLRDNPDWEVLIMAGHMFRYFTPEQRQYVLEKVKNGAGLVIVQPDGTDPLPSLCPLQQPGGQRSTWDPWTKTADHFITTGIPWEALPRQVDACTYQPSEGAQVLARVGNDPLLAIRQVGKGRVVALAYRSADPNNTKDAPGNYFGLMPFMTGPGGDDRVSMPTFKYWEYHFSLLCKSILWAAGKEPALLVEKLDTPSGKLSLTLNNRGQPMNVALEIAIADRFGNPIHKASLPPRPVPAGSSAVEVPIPDVLRAGVNLIDLFIRDEQGRIVNWASASVQATYATQLAEVKDGKTLYRPGDAVQADVKLSGKPAGGLSLTMRLKDGFDRVLAESTGPAASDTQKFQLKLSNPVNRLLIIEAELRQGDRVLDTCQLYRPVDFPLRATPHEGEMILLGWNMMAIYGLNNYLVDPFVQWLSDLGFNAALTMGRDDTPTVRQGLWRHDMLIQGRGPDMSMSSPTGDPDHPIRVPCLSDPAFLASAEPARTGLGESWLFSVQAADEVSYGRGEDPEFCFSEHCMKAMRQWLRTEYPSLDALNKQWGTDFKTWDDVRPMTLKELRAKKSTNYSSWCDHRTFNEIEVANFYRTFSRAIAQGKPGLRYGPSGNPAPGAHGGYDYWQLRDALTFLASYSGYDELALWARDTTEVLKYTGFGDENDLRYGIYFHLLFGLSGNTVCGTQRLPAFDWTDSRAARGYRAAYAQLNGGIGRLLNESHRTPDPVALHYSRNASRIAEITGHAALWDEMRWKLRTFLDDCGFDHNWLSYEQLESGQTKDLKVIYLPMSCTITDKEATALEQFVNSGGLLIGELAIGIADGHGRMLPAGRPDDLFGISRRDSQVLLRPDLAKRNSASSTLGLSFPEMPVDYIETGLKAESAAVLATAVENGRPLAFANPHGKGLAVYLACNLDSSYDAINAARGVGDNARFAAEAERFISDLFQKAGVSRRLKITAEDGAPVPFVKTVLFTQGDVKYYGILREYPIAKDFASAPANVKIRFPGAAGYIREVFSGTDYGQVSEVSTVFTPTTLALYSVVPYKVDQIAVSLGRPQVHPGEILAYRFEIKAAAASSNLSDHTLRMRVLDPGGKESRPYTCNLTARAGVASGTIPTALNDRQGNWTIEVNDLTSGKTAAAAFEVK